MRSHRYRGAALLYGALALIVVGLALLTGGDLARAIVVAILFWLVATGWTWWRLRTREEADDDPSPEEKP